MIRKKGKARKGNVHLIILYRENLSGRGKRGIVAKGRERDVSRRKRDVSRKKIAEGIGIWREIN